MKKKNNFVVGDRVGIFQGKDEEDISSKITFNEYNEPSYGQITDTTKNGQVIVYWDDEWMRDDASPTWDPDELCVESELKATWSSLEKEFKSLEKEISNKLKEAGKLIKDANKIAKKQGYNLSEMYDAVAPLYSAMDASGWRTSSFGC